MELAQLVGSELVTNARKYAPGPVLLDLRITGDMVEASLWDSDLVLPIARAADAGRVGQHGLEIVMAVAWGFEAQREPVGKSITACLAWPTTPPDAHPGRGPAASLAAARCAGDWGLCESSESSSRSGLLPGRPERPHPPHCPVPGEQRPVSRAGQHVSGAAPSSGGRVAQLRAQRIRRLRPVVRWPVTRPGPRRGRAHGRCGAPPVGSR